MTKLITSNNLHGEQRAGMNRLLVDVVEDPESFSERSLQMARQWTRRHNSAVYSFPHGFDREAAILKLINGADLYIDIVEGDYGWENDGYLDTGIADILHGIRVLLDGDIGRLDAGTIGEWLDDAYERIGRNPDTGETTTTKAQRLAQEA